VRQSLSLALLFFASAVSALAAPPLVVETDPLRPEEQIRQFHLPEGFGIKLIVADPDIGQPMNMNFDAHGRLWITHVLEYPYPARGEGVEPRDARFPQVGDHEPRDRLSVIEHVGTPDQKITHFATGLNIPIGNVPTPRGTIVFSIPDLWFCPDADGDLHADSRDLLYGRFGNVDTHGMVASLTRWIDGWVYATHGFRNTSHVKGGDGHAFTMNSGNTFRFKEDGSHIEQFTWGQVNPFGLTFDPWGNAYTADCHSMPLTGLIRQAYYSSFGKPHDGLGFGPDMIDHIHGSTGICGAAWYQAAQFPEEYRGCIFLCNPVNGLVHRDRIEFHGSSPWVVTQPEFISCDDGWFRPVDVKLGPDGALYVADFYNCIIGHYEVPLDHPRRSRDKGRIWKITWRGDRTALPDLAALGLPQLIERLGDPNITVRTLATNAVYGRFGAEAIEPCTRVLATGGTPEQIAGAGWLLERLGALSSEEFDTLRGHESDVVRTHAARILAERAAWTDVESAAALRLLSDSHPMVRRAAADAIGRHPRREFLLPLLNASANTGKDDPFLRHTIKIALRNHVLVDEIAALKWDSTILHRFSSMLAGVAIGAHSESAGGLLLRALQQGVNPEVNQADILRHVARYARLDDLRAYAARLSSGGGSLRDQHQQLLALVGGLEARNVRPAGIVGDWSGALVQQLLEEQRAAGLDWTVRPVPGRALEPDAFTAQPRDYAGGSEPVHFHSSLPKGERKTGILRSEPFPCPATLSFSLAGHDGVPENPPQMKNSVRLILADAGTVIASAPPPRNDLAQKVEWNLDQHQNQPVRFEIVDGDDGAGYAWLAAGNFSLPALNPAPFSARDAAADLVARLRLENFAPQLAAVVADEQASLPARLRWSGVLLALHPDARLRGLLDAVSGDVVPPALQARILAAVVSRTETEIDECLTQTARAATALQQRQLAEQLSADRAGSEALLKLTTLGLSSPRLLRDPRIAERVRAAVPDGDAMIAKLVEGLPEPVAEIEKLIADRRNSFTSDGTTPERGRALFKQHCAACHQLGADGKKVGPVLDGIGLRGAERLFEDILDPSRNVDAAFRTATILNHQGQILTGLLVREEGATLILVDTKGQEFAVRKADIDEQSPSGLSLMPGNWGEVIPLADLNEIVAELLRSTQPPVAEEQP
jgi:putative heme-binding domain-containing protein